MKNYHVFLNIVATIIIGLAVIGVLAISFNYLKIPATKVQTIKIEYNNSKDVKKNLIAIKKLDSLLTEIKTTSNKIQQKQLELVENKSDDNFFNKLYTAIVAIILAIAGFFGFKSISEIKTQALDDAKIEATKIAKEESTKISKEESRKIAKKEFRIMFNDEYEAKIFTKANQAMNAFLMSEINNLETRIFALEENIKSDQHPAVDINENDHLNTEHDREQNEDTSDVVETNEPNQTPNLETENPFE